MPELELGAARQSSRNWLDFSLLIPTIVEVPPESG